MRLGDTPTGAIVNGVRLVLAFLGVAATMISIAALARLLFATDVTSAPPFRWYLPAGLFLAGLVLFRVAKTFSINSYPFLIPDILREAQKKKYDVADMERMIRTLEAHTGSAAFFNRIGFSGVSLGTISSAFLVIVLGMFALSAGLIDGKEFQVFMDLAKLLFGAFVGSFATRLPISQEAGGKRASESLSGQSSK